MTANLRDQQHLAPRRELASGLAEGLADVGAAASSQAPKGKRTVAPAPAIFFTLLAIAVFLATGNPEAPRLQANEEQHGLGEEQMDAMIGRLAARLKENPQDLQGWIMLARAQAVLGRFDAASEAYAKSVAMYPDNAQLLADYADTLAMAQGGRFAGEPEMLVARALAADPNNAKALALAGTLAFDKQDYALAVRHWERLRTLTPPGSEFAESAQQSIAEARSLLPRPRPAPAATAISQAPADR